MQISGRINVFQEKDPHLRQLFKPIELRLVQNDPQGNLKVIKNSFNHGEQIQDDQFDLRKKDFLLEGKDMFQGININVDPKKLYLQTTKFKNNDQDINHLGLINVLLFNSNQKYRKDLDKVLLDYQNKLTQEKQEDLKRTRRNILQQTQNIQRPLTFNTDYDRIKIMICVTVYSEKLQEIQKTLQGIAQNIQKFYNQKIYAHQILVTFIFDGIANIHNNIDENNLSYHDNIIPYFSSTIDKKYGIKDEKTLEYQYNQYVTQQKRFYDYSPENIKKLRGNKQALLQKFKKHRKDLLLTMSRLLGENFTQTEEFIEQNIVNAMTDQYKRAKKYLDERNDTAWVYQDICHDIETKGSMPVFYVFKFKNGSKLSSHMWFFEGFCKEFQPDYCILMDVGANPEKDAIFRLVMAMEANTKVGGVCGTMRIEIEEEDKNDVELDVVSNFLINKVFSIQKCQSCEYDIAHLLDKQAESALDFIHVLPGAFSGYRYKAFYQKYNEKTSTDFKNSILEKYLRQVLDPNYEHESLQEANMFLAEDRVLCQLLFCNGYYLRYIPESIVYVDACTSLKMLLLQRRRWINGSWYALEYVTKNYRKDLDSSNHDCLDKWKFIFSITQAQIQQLMIYYMESFQIVWLYMIMYAITDTGDEGLDNFINSTVVAFYVFLIFTVMYLSLNYDPALIRKLSKQSQQKIETDYYFSRLFLVSTLLGFISLGTVVYTIYLLITEIFMKNGFNDLVEKPHVPQSYYLLLVVISIGSLALPILLSFILCPTNGKNIFNVIFTMIPYFYYQPTYSHLFVIYSFCRIDDLSWGTKGLTLDSNSGNGTITSDKGFQKFQFLLKWIIANAIATAILLILFQIDVFLLPQGIILCFSVILTIFTILKGILAIYYKIKYLCLRCKIEEKIIKTPPKSTLPQEERPLNDQSDDNKNRNEKFAKLLEDYYRK